MIDLNKEYLSMGEIIEYDSPNKVVESKPGQKEEKKYQKDWHLLRQKK